MGTKQAPGQFDCYAHAEIDEPMFVLLARDPLAPDLIRAWASRAEDVKSASPEKIAEALACADECDAYRKAKELA